MMPVAEESGFSLEGSHRTSTVTVDWDTLS